ncbi:copper chaperone PCu(A)C [Pseudomonas stutzeri]|nr:copper chaperone PCu(A)C [Stutzerimonas stutzeri]
MLIRTLSLAALLAAALPSFAEEYKVGALTIDQPWSRELPPNAPAGAAYFTLHNQGDADRLVAASTPRAGHSELHAHLHQDGLMKMVQIPAVEIPAKGAVAFQPGGNHVMLFGLAQPLKAGERFPLTLEFEKAGKVEVQVEVRSADGHMGHGMPMDHGKHRGH